MELYVSPDGNYGDNAGMVVVNAESFDEHFWGYLDTVSDWLRPDYTLWFADNNHDFEQDPNTAIAECKECEVWIRDFTDLQN